MNPSLRGHLSALFCIVVWGSTFIASKVLLTTFSAVELIVIRFSVGVAALALARPRRLRTTGLRQEAVFAAAGLTGVTLYFLLENTALTYTLAANVGIIIAAAPLFTGLLSSLLSGGQEKPGRRFFLGFALAITGIAVISLNGRALRLNPLGDLLTVGAALSWAVYTLLLRRISRFGYDSILCTRRIFGWGLVFIVLVLPFAGFSPDLSALFQPRFLLLFLYLGVCACALCYFLWNAAILRLGPVRTNTWLYLSPVVTLLFSVLLLHEPVTPQALLGILLILSGLILSQRQQGRASARPRLKALR